ncbi:malonyl-CoA:anthocyanidin 5-O-glucoside-6''-O-malonyltransferase-like [Lolium rigidum]|uniref:malonyl-CoA:anthocyanidin 5-O-glucoside-6''-O-malonyltransferase-like n=1 Tax=Lolium rigidum TaxID=89674 RepID=UPI001F5D4A11|nr:malonyl-CoA:anthocyanidin 5-O-glucoside-6''-O-malonyltransferase-like [Lolium rigidum]
MPTAKIVEVGRVSPPPEDLVLRLSALDAQWLTIPLIQRVLLFDDGAGDQLPPFESLVSSLRASLAATLARFPPLAGRIVYMPSTGDAAIDCSAADSEGGGVRFVVSEMEGADARKLAGDTDHDVDAFKALVPKLAVEALPAEVLAVQVTRLKGGVAVGVAMHHAVVDGRSVWRFLEAWASACRGDDAVGAPTFERAAVALPGGEELARSTLRKYAPDLPLAPMMFPPGPNLPRRTFIVTAQHIHRLKQRISDLTTSPPSAQTAPSSFVAIAALTWVSFVRSKHPDAISADDDVYLFFFCDCRGRCGIDPPVGDNYFGTCISGCLAKATARDLLAVDGVATAAAAVQGEVRRAAEDPLALWDWMDTLSWLPLDRLVNVSGSARFPAYEAADFGWGAPSRTELVTMNNGGQLVLVAAKEGGGAVQASVCMEPVHMDAFNSHFLNSLVD